MNSQNIEGNLLKWTNYVMGWKLRHFVLRGNILYYYLSKGEKVKGKIHLNVAEVIPLEHNPLKFQIDTGTTMVYLCALEESDKVMWVDALEMIKKKEIRGVDSKALPSLKSNFIFENNVESILKLVA